MELTAPNNIMHYLECSCICCLYSRRTMFQHLVSGACQCSSITSALCLLFNTSSVIALMEARKHTRTHANCLHVFSLLLVCSISLLLLPPPHRLQLWEQDVLALCVLNTCFNEVFLRPLTEWKPQWEQTCFSFSFLKYCKHACLWFGLAPLFKIIHKIKNKHKGSAAVIKFQRRVKCKTT